jgi:hypothetical protein
MLKKAGIDFIVHRYEYDASTDRVRTTELEILPEDTRHHASKRTDVAILAVEESGPVPPGDRG